MAIKEGTTMITDQVIKTIREEQEAVEYRAEFNRK
jgi:hypothetical protein